MGNVRKAISRKTPSWATSVINLVQREIDRTGHKILGNNKNQLSPLVQTFY
jgi:hypothetical protein